MIQERERKAVGEAVHQKARADGTQHTGGGPASERPHTLHPLTGRKAEHTGTEAGRSIDLVVGGEGKKKKLKERSTETNLATRYKLTMKLATIYYKLNSYWQRV